MNTAQLDELLDQILRASGSRLRNYTMQKHIDDMREAVRQVYKAGWNDAAKAFGGCPIVTENEAALRQVAADIRKEYGFD
jgi:hypothetical protein